jgi:rRNA maturation endonuclease Nob1
MVTESANEWPIVIKCRCGKVYEYPHFHWCPVCGLPAKANIKVKEHLENVQKDQTRR